MSGKLSSELFTIDAPSVGLTLRMAWLGAGLAVFGVSLALLVRARLGLDPWDVLNQGIALRLRIQMGWVVDAVGVVVLLAWIPLHQRVGVGTACNVVVVGLVVNGALDLIPRVEGLTARCFMLAGAILLNGLATSFYIGAGLGPGPRDGLMLGLATRGHSVRSVRTLVELSVLAVGVVLGGTVGIGTVAYALAIGPIVHFSLPRLTLTCPLKSVMQKGEE